MTRKIGLYLHIPFCKSKCAYCDFSSFAGCEGQMAAVTEKMQEDLFRAGNALPGAQVQTLYIGGGTPSILPPDLFSSLLCAAHRAFDFSKDAECSCEMNPGTVTEEFLDAAVRHGINRVSLGAQSADDRLLRLLMRIHTFPEVQDAVSMVRAAGISNINLDLMLGLPTQTLADVQDTLDQFLSLSPTHMSCYGLIVEDGTRMARMVDTGAWVLPDEDLEREMYELARKTCEAAGLMQYEISNFAQPGKECRHNVDCWMRREYVGIGVSACGFLGNLRYKNPDTIDGYLRGLPPENTLISQKDARFESVMLGLRMTKGISDRDFATQHGVSIREAFGDKLDQPIAQGLLTLENGWLRLTRRGMDVQNSVLVDLMD